MSARLHLVDPAAVADDRLLPRPVHYFGAGGTALAEWEVESLRVHRRWTGPRADRRSRAAAARLADAVEDADLRGRGGAHFPVAVKWRTARTAGAVTVVANGAEGEPLSRKDTALLEMRPHLVLDGLAATAEAVGAGDAVVYLHEGNHAARVAVARALAEREVHEDDPPIRLETGPDGYLTGESSAVGRAVLGGPALPRFRRSAPGVTLPGERHVLVHNVETLARIALLDIGLPATDTALVSVAVDAGVVVLELRCTDTIGDAVGAVTGRDSGRDSLHAVLIGGYGGSWAPWHRAADLPLDDAQLRLRGLGLGAGILHPLPADRCGLVRAAEIAGYLAASGARQCGPCLFGLDAMAASLNRLAAAGSGHRPRRARREPGELEDFVAAVRGRGACHHPDGAAQMVTSALRTFAPDVRAHLRGGCRHEPDGWRRRG